MTITGKTLGQWALLGSFALVLYFCYQIMEPFLMPVFLALILSTLLTPVYETLAHRLNNRPSLAALLVCLGLTIAILLPVLLLSISLAREANQVYEQLRQPETLARIQSWLDPTANPIFMKLREWLPDSLRLEEMLRNFDIGSRIGTQAQAIGTAALAYATTFAAGIFGFLMDYFIMIVVLFFLLRDSAYFERAVRQISPLSADEEHMFVDRFRVVTRATVLGNLLTAVVQGLLSSVIFWILGLPNPILWGALTALFSLVPVVGTALIWLPWTIYLLASGSVVRAIIFAILQIVLVGGADNVLRPLLIEGRVKMHTLVVFFSILGGIGYFGILGMFIGPLVFAIAITFMEFYGSRSPAADNRTPPLSPTDH
jgi:predicted PurR-regulated permease PerM